MLSDHEQRVLAELECSLGDATVDTAGPQNPPRRAIRDRFRLAARACALLLGSLSVVLVMTGAASGGLALAVATALGGALWHYWPDLADDAVTAWPGRPRDLAGRRPGSRLDGPGGPGALHPTRGGE